MTGTIERPLVAPKLLPRSDKTEVGRFKTQLRLKYAIQVTESDEYDYEGVERFKQQMLDLWQKPHLEHIRRRTSTPWLTAAGILMMATAVFAQVGFYTMPDTAIFWEYVAAMTLLITGAIGFGSRTRKILVKSHPFAGWEILPIERYTMLTECPPPGEVAPPIPDEARVQMGIIREICPNVEYLVHVFHKDPFIEAVNIDPATGVMERRFIYHFGEPNFQPK